MTKPGMYLDVDGVLWVIDDTGYHGAPGVAEFMDFALENFEVRWCTCWTMSGAMDKEDCERLAEWTGVSADVWQLVQPSLGFYDHKTECIDWDEVAQRHTTSLDHEVGAIARTEPHIKL